MITEHNPSIKYMHEVIKDAGIEPVEKEVTKYKHLDIFEAIFISMLVGSIAFTCGIDIGKDIVYKQYGVEK